MIWYQFRLAELNCYGEQQIYVEAFSSAMQTNTFVRSTFFSCESVFTISLRMKRRRSNNIGFCQDFSFDLHSEWSLSHQRYSNSPKLSQKEKRIILRPIEARKNHLFHRLVIKCRISWLFVNEISLIMRCNLLPSEYLQWIIAHPLRHHHSSLVSSPQRHALMNTAYSLVPIWTSNLSKQKHHDELVSKKDNLFLLFLIFICDWPKPQ